MRVSVIIPVYNAEDYVTEAVESALAQPETAEVLLIEDGSSDDSLIVCEKLAQNDARITLLRHPNEENRGAGASRNLGIQHSTSPFIAFLDADDYYAPGRFATASEIFSQHADVDGVYGATGVHFEGDEAYRQWIAWKGSNASIMTAMAPGVEPEELFAALVLDDRGSFHTNAIVVKRELFERTGLFDTHLRLHQDTAMWVRMAAMGRIVPGRLGEPVAIRRMHGHNRVTSQRTAREKRHTRMLLWRTLWHWSMQHLSPAQQEMLLNALFREYFRPFRAYPTVLRHLSSAVALNAFPFKHPEALRRRYFWKQYVARMLRHVGLWNLVQALRGKEPQ